MDSIPINEKDTNDIQVKETIKRYTRYWYLLIFGLIIGLLGAYLYLRYSTPNYITQASILIKDKRNESSSLALSGLGEGNIFSGVNGNRLIDELVLLKSNRVVFEVIKNLNLNIKYEQKGRIKSDELYLSKPFIVNFNFTNNKDRSELVFISIIDSESFELFDASSNKIGDFNFFETIPTSFGSISVMPNLINSNERFSNFIGDEISVNYSPVAPVTRSYIKKIQLDIVEKSSNVVNIGVQSEIPEKSEDFIEELINQFNIDSANDQNQIVKKTSDFINSRLVIIAEELDSVEIGKAQFKSNNSIINVENDAAFIAQKRNEIKYNKLDITSQIKLANNLINYLNNTGSNELLPTNLGIESQDGILVSQYNQLIIEKNSLLKTSTEENPIILSLNDQIQKLRQTILSTLKNRSETLNMNLNEISSRGSDINLKAKKVPTIEKSYIDIERQRIIKEELYLFLLQRREESAMSLAATENKAKVLNSVFTNKKPVSPNNQLVYGIGILLGLAIPIASLYMTFLFNNKVNTTNDIERVLKDIPLLGEIPKIGKSENDFISQNDRSPLAESFRTLRTNLQFLIKEETNNIGKTLFVTSTIQGEGKTFVAYNLALTLSLLGKKVVLVGADIRNPKLTRYLKQKSDVPLGLTEFIVDDSLSVDSIISSSDEEIDLDIVHSGIIPPNPAELLLKDRTSYFFNSLKESYDYVVVDTAPSMLVTDTIIINPLADLTLYVVRAGVTDKKLLEFPKDAVNQGRLSNLAIVFNGIDLNKFGYGNKYGYTYAYSYTAQEKTSVWHRLFKNS